jgi:hypothetical protein
VGLSHISHIYAAFGLCSFRSEACFGRRSGRDACRTREVPVRARRRKGQPRRRPREEDVSRRGDKRGNSKATVHESRPRPHGSYNIQQKGKDDPAGTWRLRGHSDPARRTERTVVLSRHDGSENECGKRFMYSAQGGENQVYKQANKPNSDLRPSLLFGAVTIHGRKRCEIARLSRRVRLFASDSVAGVE